MLEYDNEDDPMLYGIVNHLRCDIMIPPCLSNFFDKKKSGVVMADDRRRYKRWNFRNLGALEIRQSFTDLERHTCWCRIYIKDISIGGVSFLHSEQLFPMEQMRILFPKKSLEPIFKGRDRNIIEVKRCRKRGQRCYEIGAQFVEEFRDQSG
ncbi:MAG: PilZ domain-containing protein [Pirellulales bacterium]|nr:PilZ domain-containing protein [Pirellulales bacterium]